MKSASRRLNDRGFTLIEIIIVLTLIILVVSLSSVYYAKSLPKFRLDGATRDITAEIRKARALSRIQNETQTILFDLDRGTFGLKGGKTRQIPEGIAVKVIHPLSGQILKGSVPIVFYASGGFEGYTIELAIERRKQTIAIDPVVGASVVVQENR